ncbi:MAG: YkgJ family cysteine cluster protein [Rubrivivax sp.]|jgi:hypothetical protein|nr:YkgJ family cysteine cluster protein [Rubrivivax sp.]
MECRQGCAACCIAPSISSPVPPRGRGPAAPKPAGRRCVQLDDALRCRLFGDPARPAVCSSLQPSPEMCGTSRDHALAWLAALERETGPRRRAG